jgi:hypothetical protein
VVLPLGKADRSRYFFEALVSAIRAMPSKAVILSAVEESQSHAVDPSTPLRVTVNSYERRMADAASVLAEPLPIPLSALRKRDEELKLLFMMVIYVVLPLAKGELEGVMPRFV